MNKPKLLLADDSVTIRKVVELTFADEGIDVSTVADAESAMQRFVEIQPDIVLVDVGLAGTNGYQICEMIKADEATKHIPVLLLVGSFEPFDQDEAERVHSDGYLTKPFHSIRDLVSKVWEMLGTRNDLPSTEVTSGQVEDVQQLAVPTFPGDLSQNEPVGSFEELDDIDNLYRSSFAETVEIENFDTVENTFDDAGLDDEMIEASYLSPPPENSFADLMPAEQKSEDIKEFDWSPESLVSEPVADEPSRASFGPRFELVEDEPSEAVLDVGQEPELAQPENQEIEIEIPEPTIEEASDERVYDNSDDDDVELFDDLGLGSSNYNAPVDAGISQDQDVDPAIHDTIPYAVGEQPPVQATEETQARVSPELIEEIARRVIERLSDGAVREIAQIEVPRIAEKLIREALEQESKS